MAAPHIGRILVAVKQPSGPLSAASLKAAQLARALKAELVLFHAIEIPLVADAYEDDQRRLGEDESTIHVHLLHSLESQAVALRAQDLAVTVAAAWDYPASAAILRHACRSGSDLLVIGQATAAKVHGSVEQVLRHSPVPVLLVRTAAPYAAPALLAALNARGRLSRTRDLNASICQLAHTISMALKGSWSAVARPAPAILRQATASRAQIIVLGARNLSRWMPRLYGGTLHDLIEGAPQDILLVKPHDFGVHFSTRSRGAHILSAGTPPFGWSTHDL